MEENREGENRQGKAITRGAKREERERRIESREIERMGRTGF